MGCQSPYHGFVTFFECPYSFAQLLVLTLTLLLLTFAKLLLLALDSGDVWFRDSGDRWGGAEVNAGAETSVLFFELGDSAFEVSELRLSTVARVLGGYSVAVSTSLFTLIWCDGGARAFARGLIGWTRTGVVGRAGGRSGTLEGRGREREGGGIYESALLCHGVGGSLEERGNRNKDMVKGNCAFLGRRGRCESCKKTRRQDTLTLYIQYICKYEQINLRY